MKKENVPIVEPMEKGEHSVYCPHCGSEHWYPEMGRKVEHIIRERDGYVQYIEHRRDDVVCQECGNEFIIDFGEDTNTVYNPPLPIDSIQECLTKYESKWHYNFMIIATSYFGHKEKSYRVECENDEYGFLLSNPFRDDLYKRPMDILKLAKTYADTEMYPK